MTDFLTKRPLAALIAGAALLGTSALAIPAAAADMEKCYGIAKQGQDDGNTEMEVPGMSTQDYDGSAFKYVTKGTCSQIKTPFGAGSLKPIDNRPPKAK